jgi:hypothetical protein
MAITSNSAPAFFRKDALDIIVKLYDEQRNPRLYTYLVKNMDHKSVNLRVGTEGDLPAAGPIDPLRGIPMVDRATPYYRDYTFTRYAIGLEYDRPLKEIDWNNLVGSSAVMLSNAMKETFDILAASLFNFPTATTGPMTLICPDGLPLISTGHLKANGVQSNVITGNPAFSWTALADGMTQTRRFESHEGNPIRRGLKRDIIVSVENSIEAMEYAKSTDRPDTTNRAINAIQGQIGEIISDPLFTSTTAWMLRDSDDNNDVQMVFRSRPYQNQWMANEFDRVRHSNVSIVTMVAKDWRSYARSNGA